MSKKRPTESSWDSDEELLSDTAGISAFPKTSELDLLAEEGELDEEALLGLDDTGAAAYSGDAGQGMVTRQRSKNLVSHQQDHEQIVEQAFVFEEADTGDLEEDFASNEVGSELAVTYTSDGLDAYAHMYHANGSEEVSHDIQEESEQQIYSGDVNASDQDYKNVDEEQVSQQYTDEQYTVTRDEEGQTSNIELGYEQPHELSEQVHLEYDDDQQQPHTSHDDIQERGEQEEEKRYESDSESDDDSRHNRGKFTTERTGVISLAAKTERETIPDTLEINEEQAAQIEEFMSDKPQRGQGRGGNSNRGRLSAHNRLGNKPGMRPLVHMGPVKQGMFRGAGPRMGMMVPRFPPPPGPQGPRGPHGPRGPQGPRGPHGPHGMPRGMMSPPGPFRGGMRPPMQPRGPAVGGMFNPMFNVGRGRQPFPGQPPPGGIRLPPDLEPAALLEPMKQLLQRMRGPQPGGMGPGGLVGLRMVGPGGVRPGLEPRIMGGRMDGPMAPPRMVRPPHLPQNPNAPPMLGPEGPQMLAMQNQLRQPIRGRLPPHMRLGQVAGNPPGPLHQASPGNKKIFINPLFQGQQVGSSGITRTVKMGLPVHQRKARALLERAKQTQARQSAVVAVKRKSSGPDETIAKVKREGSENDEPERVVEKKEQSEEGSNEMSSMLEEQKRKRELIQRKKEMARQKLADEKRKELEKKMKEGQKIQSIVGGTSGSDKRTVEKSGDAAPIRVVARSVTSRLGPPPVQNQTTQLQARGLQSQNIRGPQIRAPTQQMANSQPYRPQFQQFRNPRPQHIRGQQQQAQPTTLQMRGPPPQTMRGQRPSHPLQQIRSPPPQLTRGPPPLHARGPPPQQTQLPSSRMTGPPPSQIRGSLSQQIRGPPPQISGPPPQIRGPPPQIGSNLSQQHRLRGPPPQQITGLQHQQLRPRGPPPQSIRGSQVQKQIQGPASVQSQVQSNRSGPFQSNAFSSTISQSLRSPPPTNVRYQAPLSTPPPALPSGPRFTAPPPQFSHQPTAIGRISYPPSNVIAQPPPQSQPLQQQYGASNYPPPSSSIVVSPSQSYSYISQPLPQAQPTQPQFQSYPVQAPPASQIQPQHQTTPVYQYGQADSQSYTGSQSQSLAPFPTATSTAAQQVYQPYQPSALQTQATYPLTQDLTSYQAPADSYSGQQTIQTIHTVQSQDPVGQRIQTIGQRIQPVTGGQMRSIIHNVQPSTSSTLSTAASRSVQQKQPTLHISRAVMEGNVQVLPGSQKVIILNVPQMATRETLIKLCRHFGHVEGVNLMRDQNKAVVQFSKGEQAAKCVSKCDQKCLHKTRLTVKLLPS